MMSLGKLGVLSTLTLQDLQTVGTQKQIEFFDDQLDLIAVQDSLATLWRMRWVGFPPICPRRAVRRHVSSRPRSSRPLQRGCESTPGTGSTMWSWCKGCCSRTATWDPRIWWMS